MNINEKSNKSIQSLYYCIPTIVFQSVCKIKKDGDKYYPQIYLKE